MSQLCCASADGRAARNYKLLHTVDETSRSQRRTIPTQYRQVTPCENISCGQFDTNNRVYFLRRRTGRGGEVNLVVSDRSYAMKPRRNLTVDDLFAMTASRNAPPCIAHRKQVSRVSMSTYKRSAGDIGTYISSCNLPGMCGFSGVRKRGAMEDE